MTHVLDLNFLDIDHTVAAFLVETSEGPILIETGPYSTFESMQKALNQHNYLVEEIKHVFLTHIHLDHAGAAWAFAENEANIYLHPIGLHHMEDPSRLYNSAKMIYGDEMERLWGKMEKVNGRYLNASNDGDGIKVGDVTIKAIHTPGHAKHHIAWQIGDDIFTGDVGGVKIGDGPVLPPCPPPDINLEDWNTSIEKLLNADAKNLYLTHFGLIKNKHQHLNELRDILKDWAYWIKERWENGLTAEQITPLFKAYTANQLMEKGVNEHGLKQYEVANPSWMSVSGLIRYWKKKSEQ